METTLKLQQTIRGHDVPDEMVEVTIEIGKILTASEMLRYLVNFMVAMGYEAESIGDAISEYAKEHNL